MENKISKEIEQFAADIYLEDKTGENFIENIIHAENLPRLLSRLKEHKIDEPVLEMGFGEGTITEPLVKAGYKVEIIEGSSKLCEDAVKRFGTKLSVVHCSYFENFAPVNLYETVLALHVLEHVDNLEEVCKCIFSWLKPGGICIAVVPNAESLHRQLSVMMRIQEKLNTLSGRDLIVEHQRVLTLNQLTTYFQNAGFEIKDKFGYFLKTVPNSMMTGWSPELIKSLTNISNILPANLMANIGVVVRRPEI